MGAGIPSYQRLFDIGKLPKEARRKIPGLLSLDEAHERIKELEAENKILKSGRVPVMSDVKVAAGSQTVKDTGEESFKTEGAESVSRGQKVVCSHPGCAHVAEGISMPQANNNLRLHMRTHEKKDK